MLDEHVAGGMDRIVQVMISQCEYILVSHPIGPLYNPTTPPKDLKPTTGCVKVVKCLKAHVKLLNGVTDKNTMEVFAGEMGARLFNLVIKWLKHTPVSQDGAMTLIW